MESKKRNNSEVALGILTLILAVAAMWLMMMSGLFDTLIPYSLQVVILVTLLVLLKVKQKINSLTKIEFCWANIRQKFKTQFTIDMVLLSCLTGYSII